MPKKCLPRSRPRKTDLIYLCGNYEALDYLSQIYPLTIQEMQSDIELQRKDFYYLQWKCKQTKNKLSKREKQTIYLYYFKLLNFPEIAKVLKIQTSVAITYAKRARIKIAKAFKRMDLLQDYST